MFQRKAKLGATGFASLMMLAGFPATSAEPQPVFPQMLPGRYEEAKQMVDIVGNVTAGARDRAVSKPPEIGTVCYSKAMAAEKSLFENRFGQTCEVRTAEVNGTAVRGTLFCKNPGMDGIMTYEGTASETAADLRVTYTFGSGKSGAETQFIASIKLKRLSPDC
ncbi:MAG TPA: DUF3617 family protein [Novosphingobium sp.]|nr:DUF3617 family protein [Novosphingobium sp.]